MIRDVFVAVKACGCICAADTTGEDVAAWVRSGLRVEVHRGVVTVPSACPTHANTPRADTPGQRETNTIQES